MGGRILVIVLTMLAAVPAPAWALAGGATGSGGGGGGGGGFSGGGGGGGFYGGDGSSGGKGSTVVAIAIVFGSIALLVIIRLLVAGRSRRRGPGFQGTRKAGRQARGRAKEAEDVAKAAQADDGYWDPDELKARVREVFFPVQSTWSERDVS